MPLQITKNAMLGLLVVSGDNDDDDDESRERGNWTLWSCRDVNVNSWKRDMGEITLKKDDRGNKVQKNMLIITSAKEVMFLPAFICLLVCLLAK